MTTTTRTVEQWKAIYGPLNAPASSELAIAQRILGDLIGYRASSTHRYEDAQQLANALAAYAKLLHEHGVTP
jgi:hypothetical protein